MRGVRLGRILLVAALVELIGLAANAVTTLVSDTSAGPLRWIAPPAVALAAALGKAVVDAVGSQRRAPGEAERPAAGAPWPVTGGPGGTYRSGGSYPGGRAAGWARVPHGGATRPPPLPYPAGPAAGRGRARGTSVLVAVLVLVVACGGGGLAISAGARYAIGWATGKETGPDRLVRPVSGRSGNLTLTVRRVLDTPHFTRVDLAVNNAGTTSVSLPLYENCLFTRTDGTASQADPFRSQWSQTVPPHAFQAGMVTFGERLPRDALRATLSFSVVFGPGGGAVSVTDIEVRPG